MQLEFAGQSAQDADNTYANTSRLLNCYREFVGDGQTVLKSVPGVASFASLDSVFSRALAEVDGLLYCAFGGKLYRISETGSVSSLGDLPNDPVTSISGNNGKVTVVSGGRYFVWDGSTLSEPTPGAFDDFADVSFFGQLTVLLEAGGRRVQWSDAAAPQTLDALNFATTESRDDKNLRCMPMFGGFWIFKEKSIEVWQQDGTGIRVVRGSTIDTGLLNRQLLKEIPNGCFFIGNDGKAYLVQGGLNPVSTIAVETSIAKESPESIVYYQDEGHEVCAITFAGRPAWCLDISTGEWHERPNFDAKHSAQCYGAHFVTRDIGGLFKVTRNFQDFDGPMTSRAVGRTFDNGGQFFTVSRFFVRGRVGRVVRSREALGDDALQAGSGVLQVGDTTGLDIEDAKPNEPQIMLRVSKDTAHTWSYPKHRSLGLVGDYDRQLVWRSLGRMKQFTPEMSWSEADEVTVTASATVDIV